MYNTYPYLKSYFNNFCIHLDTFFNIDVRITSLFTGIFPKSQHLEYIHSYSLKTIENVSNLPRYTRVTSNAAKEDIVVLIKLFKYPPFNNHRVAGIRQSYSPSSWLEYVALINVAQYRQTTVGSHFISFHSRIKSCVRNG